MDELKQYVGIHLVQAAPDDKLVPAVGGDISVAGYYVRHESWSPKATFEQAYRASGELDFSMALFMAKRGCKVKRAGWVQGSWAHVAIQDSELPALMFHCSTGGENRCNICSGELFATDWCIVE